ncbi:hypothetical protein EDC14_10832 [Hydrogenispora ethanolica]|uniref:Uncharacterized protein n=1 Tax=Hydrogenispora ethanolica TaxID=1082276 RepID=A0A4R1QIS2_HYDET|nr:hypothetical protein [Hydrogenispora ethanolica]TCL53498.1 hypothetical protein EDC14_10832 [Hydrogenispora ethanolica]
MKIVIEIAQYSPNNGIAIEWLDGSIVESKIVGNTMLLKANKEGLTSLAQSLLTLAQEGVEPGNHIHFDEFNLLQDGSSELVIERI